MGNRKVVYISPNNKKGWDVKGENAQRAIKHFEKKEEAIDFGRGVAKNADIGQLKIQKRNGTLEKEYTYGKDPYPPVG
jgi:hypothetical protein